MKNWNRKDIVSFITEIESQFEFLDTRINGVLIWPWVRVKLFFFLIENLERKKIRGEIKDFTKKSDTSNWKYVFFFFKEFFKLLKIKKSDFLFIGANSHRQTEESVSYNKFFDPFRKFNLNGDGILVEYSKPTEKSYLSYKNLSFSYLKVVSKYFYAKPESNNKYWKELELYLCTSLDEKLSNEINGFVKKLKKMWLIIQIDKKTWYILLKILKPKKIFTLCYYSNDVYSLNLAASERGIETIEMQHGPINELHLAYGGFDNLNLVSKSSLLPDNFLVWDNNSCDVLSKSFPDKDVNIVGLSWFDFFNNYKKINSKKKIVLYALQPMSEIGELFPGFIVDWIRESSKEYIWYIRLHPRQLNEKEEIIKRLVNEGLYDLVNIDEATLYSLPSLMAQSQFIITNFSGVIIEGALLNKKMIGLHPYALAYYPHEFETKKMFYYDRENKKHISWSVLETLLDKYFENNNGRRINSLEEFNRLFKI